MWAPIGAGEGHKIMDACIQFTADFEPAVCRVANGSGKFDEFEGVGIIKLFIGVNCGRKFTHKVPMK